MSSKSYLWSNYFALGRGGFGKTHQREIKNRNCCFHFNIRRIYYEKYQPTENIFIGLKCSICLLELLQMKRYKGCMVWLKKDLFNVHFEELLLYINATLKWLAEKRCLFIHDYTTVTGQCLWQIFQGHCCSKEHLNLRTISLPDLGTKAQKCHLWSSSWMRQKCL